MLQGSSAPPDLTAPTFALLGTVVQGGPVYGFGEPSVTSDLRGHLYLTSNGCNGTTYPEWYTQGMPSCGDAPLFRTSDPRSGWTLANDPSTGKLAPGAPNAIGDASVATDAEGTVYAADLGPALQGVQMFRSVDHGRTWTYLGNVSAPSKDVDRPWVAAADAGHIVTDWIGGPNSTRLVVRASRDGGDTWSAPTLLGSDAGPLGPPRFDPTGSFAYIPFVQCVARCDPPSGPLPSQMQLGPVVDLAVARSRDGGGNWTIQDTGVHVRSPRGDRFGLYVFPDLAVTQSGRVVLVWSQGVTDPTGSTEVGAVVRMVASDDRGATWSTPRSISRWTSAVMPWVSGGAASRSVVTYYASPTAVHHDLLGPWSVRAAVVASNGTIVRSTVAPDVHLAGICTNGGYCPPTSPCYAYLVLHRCAPPAMRNLMDFFQNTLLPNGRILVAYASDPPQGGGFIQVNVAMQEGGSPLFVPAHQDGARSRS